VEVAGPTGPARVVLRIVLALGALAAMAIWSRANRTALDLLDWCECASRTVTVRVVLSRPAAVGQPSPALRPVQAEEYEPAGR
jgi:hypothetical protein